MAFRFSDVEKNRALSFGFLGFGVSNHGVLPWLKKNGYSRFTVRSKTPLPPCDLPAGISRYTGDGWLDGPLEDVLVCSPTVRRENPRFRGRILTSDAEIFFSEVKGETFAVSGSDGKSTTTAMIHALLTASRHTDVALVGNIGASLTASLDRDREGRLYAAELSSFQLQYTTPHVKRAVITSLSENHLDWHRDFAEYRAAKAHLFAGCDEPILFFDDEGVRGLCKTPPFAAVSLKASEKELAALGCKTVITVKDGFHCRDGKALMPIFLLKRQEPHNLINFALAVAATSGYAADGAVYEVARHFTGLPHRMAEVATVRGVKFVDSSIDTSPARTAVTLTAVKEPVVLLLGGRSKNLSLTPLAQAIKAHCRSLVFFGEAAAELTAFFGKADVPHHTASDMREAVKVAFSLASPGDTVLLSPAHTSFDSYKNYAERGDDFSKCVFDFLTKKYAIIR